MGSVGTRRRRLNISYLTYYRPSHDETPVATHFVPLDHELHNAQVEKLISIWIVYLGLSRRELGKLVAAVIFDPRNRFIWRGTNTNFIAFEHEIRLAFGIKERLLEDPVEKLFPNKKRCNFVDPVEKAFTDESFRWFSTLVSRAFRVITPRTQRPQLRVLPRLRLLAMTMMVVSPDDARMLFLV